MLSIRVDPPYNQGGQLPQSSSTGDTPEEPLELSEVVPPEEKPPLLGPAIPPEPPSGGNGNGGAGQPPTPQQPAGAGGGQPPRNPPTRPKAPRRPLPNPIETDSLIERNRASRRAEFILIYLLIPVIPLLFFLSGIAGRVTPWIAIVLFAALAELGVRLFPNFTKWTPNAQALVTQNPFSGTRVAYGPGLNLSHFYEEVDERGNFSLETITESISVEVPTSTSKVIAKVSLQLRANLRLVERLVGVDGTTITSGFSALIRSYLTGKFARETAENARAKIDECNIELEEEFMTALAETPAGVVSGAEYLRLYGMGVIIIKLESMELPPEVQKTRNAVDEAAQFPKIVATMYGLTLEKLIALRESGQISEERYTDMLDRALVASGNDAKLNVVGGRAGNAIAAGASKFLGEGGAS
ncbi:MAG TPA: hypothetical protein VJI74_02695 [Candidatus Paceibacterota bacterium]